MSATKIHYCIGSLNVGVAPRVQHFSAFHLQKVLVRLVDHDILFEAVMKRGLPLAIVRFLLSWYMTQSMCVRWK